MYYFLTGIEIHPDMGFGITGDAYYASAEHLRNNHFENYDATQQAEMPQNFLYRHSIELYLKSLIVIFHKKLKIDYGSVPCDSDEPEIYTNGKWRKLYSCHFIDELYTYWLNSLLLKNLEKLKAQATDGDWQEEKKISELIPSICKYDRDSSYFRYPLTKNSSLDFQKNTVQKYKSNNVDDLAKEIKNSKRKAGKGTVTMLIVDDEDNIINAFGYNDNILSEIRDALFEVAFYFHCMHIMTRVTLCDGM
jgi:hypothetical protein